MSYRSKVKYQATGDVALSGDGTPGSATAASLMSQGGYASDLKASLTMPDTAILSVTQKLDSKWEMLGDVSVDGLEFDSQGGHHAHLRPSIIESGNSEGANLGYGFQGRMASCPWGQLHAERRVEAQVWCRLRSDARKKRQFPSYCVA